MSIEQNVFNLFGDYLALNDINQELDPQSQGRGFLQRYYEMLGEELDIFLLPKIDNLVAHTHLPPDIVDTLVPIRERSLGLDEPLYDSMALRKKLLKYLKKCNRKRGTFDNYIFLFGLLGFDVTITETYNNGRWDDGFWDTGFWDSYANINASYLLSLIPRFVFPITPNIQQQIQRIIKYNNPIHATPNYTIAEPIDNSKGLYFDSLNDSVILPEIMTRFIESNTDFSISIIFKNRNPVSGEYLIYHPYRFGIQQYNGFFRFAADDGGSVYWDNTILLGIPIETMQHFVITNKRGAVNGFKLYRNGELITTQNAFNHNTGATGQGHTGRLGVRQLNPSTLIASNIYDIKVWDRLLTDVEIGNVFALINPDSAKANLRVDIPLDSIFLSGGFPVVKEKIQNLDCPLSGYATGAKGIVDQNSNDIQLVP